MLVLTKKANCTGDVRARFPLDPPLSDAGLEQAQQLSGRLSSQLSSAQNPWWLMISLGGCNNPSVGFPHVGGHSFSIWDMKIQNNVSADTFWMD